MPSFNGTLPIQLPPKLRHSPRHNRQTKSRPLRLRSKKWLQNFLPYTLRARPARRLPPQTKIPRHSPPAHPHSPAARSRFQRIDHKIRQNLAHRLRTRRQFCSAATTPTSSATPRRSASCRKTPLTSSATARASQVATTAPPRIAGRLNCSNWFSFDDSRPISSNTIFVSPRIDYRLDIPDQGGLVELDGLGEIDLGDDRDVGAVEDRRVLERLVLAFGHGNEHETKVLPEIVGRRAHQIADVFDEQKVERRPGPIPRAPWKSSPLPDDTACRS